MRFEKDMYVINSFLEGTLAKWKSINKGSTELASKKSNKIRREKANATAAN